MCRMLLAFALMLLHKKKNIQCNNSGGKNCWGFLLIKSNGTTLRTCVNSANILKTTKYEFAVESFRESEDWLLKKACM